MINSWSYYFSSVKVKFSEKCWTKDFFVDVSGLDEKRFNNDWINKIQHYINICVIFPISYFAWEGIVITLKRQNCNRFDNLIVFASNFSTLCDFVRNCKGNIRIPLKRVMKCFRYYYQELKGFYSLFEINFGSRWFCLFSISLGH